MGEALAQLPDSRRAILTELKSRRTATISQLAGVLNLTGEAVRQQLLLLQQEGWVAPLREPRNGNHRTGRPASKFQLTTDGDDLFPKSYDDLASDVLSVVDELGSDVARRFFGRLTDERVTAAEPSVRDLPLPAKVDALKAFYVAGDPYMDAETTGDGFRLIERNCPYFNVAMQRPGICSVSVNALTRLLGVRVVREEAFQRGDGRCVFRILANEPVDTVRIKFLFEDEA